MRFVFVGLQLVFLALPVRAQLPNYRVAFGLTAETPRRVVLRQWEEDGQPRCLLLNPETLETTVVSPPARLQPLRGSDLPDALAATPYGRALRAERQRDGALQDAGLERADTTERGFSLTIDLCPSTKPLTRAVFEDLLRAFEPSEKPVPVTITVTGVWMETHPDDLAYLKSLVRRGELRITWVNHSYHHRFDPRRPLPLNFLLEPATNLEAEVLLNEQAMLQNGLTPSPFFRFPGLVSDKAVFDRVLALGLLPIGSDAWLAKNQAPGPGSFVLIHANGNEPLGVADFIQLLRQKSALIRNKTWLLYELPGSVARSESR